MGECGDTLYVLETSQGIELTPYDPEFAAQMEVAKRVMRDDRDVFVDGNKRTALVVARAFPRLNGCDLVASQEAKYLAVMGMAEVRLSEGEFADWVREHLTPDR